MPFEGLSGFIDFLEQKNELVRIKEFIDPELEITEITDRITKSSTENKALLFENNGTRFPLLINMFGSRQRMCYALNTSSLDKISEEINDLFEKFSRPPGSFYDKIKTLSHLRKISSYFPFVAKTKAPCQEVVELKPSLSSLPVLKCWPHDKGRFITLPVVHTRDLNTGIRNKGMYRMQVFSDESTGMHWHIHKTGARHFCEYREANKLIPAAVTLGGDPVYSYCASAPLPDNFDEYVLAGFLRKKPVKLTRCITQNIEVPSDSDIVIEGFIDPSGQLCEEGPFGDHTGFYSLPGLYPVFHVTCITHRKNAVYPATIVGIPPHEDYQLIKASERIFLPVLNKTILNEVIDMNMPDYGVAHNLVIVKIKNEYPGQAHKVAHSLWGNGQMSLNKVLVITDTGPFNETEILYKLLNIDFTKNIILSSGPLDVLEHATGDFAFGGKIAIDITSAHSTNITEPDQQELTRLFEFLDTLDDIGCYKKELIRSKILLVSLKNKETGFTGNFVSKLAGGGFSPLYIVICDEALVSLPPKIILWHCLANFNPQSDFYFMKPSGFNTVLLDCTSKPGPSRNWPNPVCSNNDTIKRIDEIWPLLGFEHFIESPSLKIKQLCKGNCYLAMED